MVSIPKLNSIGVQGVIEEVKGDNFEFNFEEILNSKTKQDEFRAGFSYILDSIITELHSWE